MEMEAQSSSPGKKYTYTYSTWLDDQLLHRHSVNSDLPFVSKKTNEKCKPSEEEEFTSVMPFEVVYPTELYVGTFKDRLGSGYFVQGIHTENLRELSRERVKKLILDCKDRDVIIESCAALLIQTYNNLSILVLKYSNRKYNSVNNENESYLEDSKFHYYT